MLSEDAVQDRRNDYDVTNTIQVSSARDVRNAVSELFADLYPASSFDAVWLAFHDFERLYLGLDPRYHGVETSYHDMQHSLDMTLAVARLLVGHERASLKRHRLGPDRAMLALVAALFHDVGYLRHKIDDHDHANGAEFTLTHVGRSGRFLENYLPSVGLDLHVSTISRVVHFTGYEINLDSINLDDPKDYVVGHLLGTADLLAQLADRCYLEKCRDRLFPEFVLGGLAFDKDGRSGVRYRSGRDLLAHTLNFYQKSVYSRLERGFNGTYRFLEPYFGTDDNLYVHFIRKNLAFLTRVLESNTWEKLRRHPPCAMPDPHGEARLMALALKQVRERGEVERLAKRLELPAPSTNPPSPPSPPLSTSPAV